MRWLSLLLIAFGLTLGAPARADDAAAIRDTIQRQLDAFRRDDAAAAFGYASPGIQSMFGTPDIFIDMVRQGYRPVYRPRVFEFRALGAIEGQPLQKVHVIGEDGQARTANYIMRRMPDGSWRIDGCFFSAPEEFQS
ncbi:MAG: DUF4864 domain-containing protein [Alphaproteobacteria bacterium]|nr:DUF4864 domain-containing protein [Alphaproteobacteria bacterium]